MAALTLGLAALGGALIGALAKKKAKPAQTIAPAPTEAPKLTVPPPVDAAKAESGAVAAATATANRTRKRAAAGGAGFVKPKGSVQAGASLAGKSLLGY